MVSHGYSEAAAMSSEEFLIRVAARKKTVKNRLAQLERSEQIRSLIAELVVTSARRVAKQV
jgi:hypothetical protein